jgi:MarR family transcriptional regulator, organic hydroperoxide resistance regulator
VKSDSVLLDLQRATHATLHTISAELTELGLTPSEINAIGNLADGRARTVSELGLAVGVRPTTLTGVLDRLAARGLISRNAKEGDRRSVVIELTPTGTRVAGHVAKAFGRVEKHLLAGVDPGAIAACRVVLAALTAGGPS